MWVVSLQIQSHHLDLLQIGLRVKEAGLEADEKPMLNQTEDCFGKWRSNAALKIAFSKIAFGWFSANRDILELSKVLDRLCLSFITSLAIRSILFFSLG